MKFVYDNLCVLAPVVQTLDSAIHRINNYPAGKYYGNQLRYLLDSDLSVDSAIRRLNNRGLISVVTGHKTVNFPEIFPMFTIVFF